MGNENNSKIRLWTSSFIIILIMSFVINGFNQMQITILPMYIIDIGGSAVISGLVTTIFSLAALAFRIPAGRLLNKKGTPLPLMAGLVVCFIASLLTAILKTPYAIIIIRFLYGAGFSFSSTAMGKAAADGVPRRRLMEGVGIVGLFIGLSASLGTSLALSVTYNFGYSYFFIMVPSALFMGLMIGLFFVRNHKKNSPETKELPGLQKADKKVISKETAAACAILMLLTIAMCAITTFLTPYGSKLGIGNISTYFVISCAASVVSRIFFGKIADRRGPAVVLIPGIIIYSLSFVMMAYLRSSTMLYVLGSLYGLAGGMVMPTVQGIIIKLCPGRTGTANALYYGSLDIGFIVGGVLLGFLVDYSGYRVMFLVISCLLSACILIFFFGIYKRSTYKIMIAAK